MNPAELTAARKYMGLNIKEFAAQINTPYRTVQNWELGKRRIPGIVDAIIELMEDKMAKVKIYRVEVEKAYMAEEQGFGFSLSPWGENTQEYEGSDDGGKDYILPSGFEVAESNFGSMEIYDEKGNHCPLTKYYDSPAIAADDGPVALKLA